MFDGEIYTNEPGQIVHRLWEQKVFECTLYDLSEIFLKHLIQKFSRIFQTYPISRLKKLLFAVKYLFCSTNEILWS